MAPADEVKLYFDYKSPFAYLAAAPAFALPERYAVAVRWIPFTLRIKGRGEQFWGHDRLPLLEDRLVEAGFRR